MRRAAEELWSIGSELLKQPTPSAEANGGDVGSAACHELQAAVDQFRHLIWTKIEEANAPSALGTEEALLALRLRRSAEMLRPGGNSTEGSAVRDGPRAGICWRNTAGSVRNLGNRGTRNVERLPGRAPAERRGGWRELAVRQSYPVLAGLRKLDRNSAHQLLSFLLIRPCLTTQCSQHHECLEAVPTGSTGPLVISRRWPCACDSGEAVCPICLRFAAIKDHPA